MATPERLLDINGIPTRTNRAHHCHFGVARHFRCGKFVLQHFLFAWWFSFTFVCMHFDTCCTSDYEHTFTLKCVYVSILHLDLHFRINFVVRNLKTYLSDAVFSSICSRRRSMCSSLTFVYKNLLFYGSMLFFLTEPCKGCRRNQGSSDQATC